MKNQYNQFESPSLLYIILSEMVFLKETRKATDYVINLFKTIFTTIRAKQQQVIKNEWTQAFLILSGYMTFSTVLLLVAYKLVMIY